MNSFYIEGRGEVGQTVQLKPEDVRHCAQVLRMETGESFYAIDAQNRRFLAELQAVS